MTLPRTDRVALVLLVAALLYFGAWHGVYARARNPVRTKVNYLIDRCRCAARS